MSAEISRWEQSSEGSTQISLKVPDGLKSDFKQACQDAGTTMTDVLTERMAIYVRQHGEAPAQTGGHYPSDPHLRGLYEACLEASNDRLKLYQRKHAGQVAQDSRTQGVTKSELADAIMELRRKGYAALGAMPIDVPASASERHLHWHIKPVCAVPADWKYREGDL